MKAQDRTAILIGQAIAMRLASFNRMEKRAMGDLFGDER